MIERDLLVARRTWWIPLSGIAEPVFYLLSIGIGIGKLVGGIPGPDGTTIPYATYVAPALLAASAMNGAVYESTFNVYFKLRVRQDLRRHPGHAGGSDRRGPGRDHLRPDARHGLRGRLRRDDGRLSAISTRPGRSWPCPAAVLIGFAFAAVGMAATTYMRGWTDFDLVQLVLLPLFLFSTTFYPLSIYPRWLQLVVRVHAAVPGRQPDAGAHPGLGRGGRGRQRRLPGGHGRRGRRRSPGRRIRVLLLR